MRNSISLIEEIILAHWCIYGRSVLVLTHWGRVTHICVGNQTIIGFDNGLSPGRRQAIIWTNAGLLSIGLLGTKSSEILIEIHAVLFRKMHLKLLSAKWQPFSLGLNELNYLSVDIISHNRKHIRQIFTRWNSPTWIMCAYWVHSLMLIYCPAVQW